MSAAGDMNTGRYVVHWFNGDGAEVFFDGEFRGGMIADTELVVAADPAAPPARKYTVRDGDRLMYTGFIERAPPATGETIDLFPQRYQVEQPAPPGAEVNETGWYLIYEPDGGGDLHRQHVRGRRRRRDPPGRGKHHAPASGRVRLQE
ncbi:hypothetical protein [Methanoculleus chikugoensis]|uniref:hypothetical protein n=1 Tax=Methanoculleus chikugoensis TaxID=118126 RepID=UPI0006CF74DB|nr:hypothetical protein [Methanoculleus chikugoensis]